MPERAKKYNGSTRPASAGKPAKLAKVGYDARRGSSQERGYTSAWQRAARLHLIDNPLCVECERHGHTEAATCVDHIIPHRGNDALFWSPDNLQSLCDVCHTRKTRKGQ